jgi:uncharacterized protein (TIGR00255 family)
MRSMTGFGLGRAENQQGALTVELRSVNSRFLDLSLRIPQELSSEESLLRSELQRVLQRGKVSVQVQWRPAGPAGEEYELNHPLLAQLEGLASQRGEPLPLRHLLAIPGVLLPRPKAAMEDETRTLLRTALAAAVEAILQERRREGAILAEALEAIRQQMLSRLAIIDGARASVVQRYREKLLLRIDELLGPKAAALDPNRIEQEVALFVDKADLSEEVTRLSAHLAQLGTLLADKGDASLGRQLEFLNQEILREINTIGSKCRDLDITRHVLDLKNLAENVREQIANLE